MAGTDHYTQAGWTREQEVTNALHSLYGREAKTMSHASSSSRTSKVDHSGIVDGMTGKRQSRRKDLMDALRNFKKEQEQHKHSQKKSSSSASSSLAGLGSKSSSIASSSNTTNRSDSHKSMAALHKKKQLQPKSSQQFQQLASESIEKENMMQDSNAFFDHSKARRSTISGSKSSRQRPITPSILTNQLGTINNHSRTKSLFMHSTNFLRNANSTSIPIKSEHIDNHDQMTPIPSDYSEPRRMSQSYLSVPAATIKQGRISSEGRSRESHEQDMHSALTYPTNKSKISTSDEQRSSQDQYRQPSLYIPVSVRKRSHTLADMNAGSKSPSFDENMVKQDQQQYHDNFDKYSPVQQEILPLPSGWTAEQDTSGLSDDVRTSFSHEEAEVDGEDVECLTTDLLLPSSMASRNTYTSSRKSSAARRYASLFKTNRSEESLVHFSTRQDLSSEDHHSSNYEHQSVSDRTNERESVKKEKVTPLPPRRQARRARVQSTCDDKKETRMAMNAVRNVEETNTIGISRPLMTERRPTYHPTTTLEVKRIQRRISESSLSSAKTFFPLHDVSTDSQQTRIDGLRTSVEERNNLGIHSLAHRSETSLHSSTSYNHDTYHQRQDSIPSTLPSLSSDQHLFSSGDEEEEGINDPTRVSISSTSSYLSSTTGTHASHSTDGTSSREGPIGPIIVQPTRRSFKAEQLYIPQPDSIQIDKRFLSELSSPTSFASANSEVWGSCYSSTNSSDGITAKQFGINQSNSARSSRRPSTATGSECGANVPPVPSLPEKYTFYHGRLGSNPQMQQRPNLRRFGSEMHVNAIESQRESQVKGSYDDMVLHSSIMKKSYTSPVIDRKTNTQDDDDDEDGEGSICLETPTFGYVASFVTAANSTPRAPNGSMFQTNSWTSPHYSPSLAQPSMNGALNSRFTRPQFSMPTSSRNNHIYGTLDPRLGIYRNPVSPKTKCTSDDEEEEESKEQSISGWRANIEAMRKEQKLTRMQNINASNPSFGLGLSHVKMALATQTHTLTKVKDIQAEQELLAKSRPSNHRSSISQGPFAAVMQNRRNSLRLNGTKSRN